MTVEFLQYKVHSYKTFFVINLQLFVISQSACTWKAVKPQFNACGQNILELIHSGRLWPCPQTLDQAEKFAGDQHSSLLRTFIYYGKKTFIKLSPDPWFVAEGAYPELNTPQKKILNRKTLQASKKRLGLYYNRASFLV